MTDETPTPRDIPHDPASATVAEISDRIHGTPREPDESAGGPCEVCGDDHACMPCARCDHTECTHYDDGLLYRDCTVEECRCHLWLSDTDCPHCDGLGFVGVDIELPNGRVREDDRPCPWCRGSGVAQ
jgi:hypothetical protein